VALGTGPLGVEAGTVVFENEVHDVGILLHG